VKKRIVLIITALAISLGGCALPQQGEASEVAKQWLGKRRHEVVAAFGQPTQETPLDSGGEILTYAKSGQKHYVFEMSPEGLIDRAVEVK
jgi:Ni/Co efflux regulator RcnB